MGPTSCPVLKSTLNCLFLICPRKLENGPVLVSISADTGLTAEGFNRYGLKSGALCPAKEPVQILGISKIPSDGLISGMIVSFTYNLG